MGTHHRVRRERVGQPKSQLVAHRHLHKVTPVALLQIAIIGLIEEAKFSVIVSGDSFLTLLLQFKLLIAFLFIDLLKLVNLEVNGIFEFLAHFGGEGQQLVGLIHILVE